MRLAATEEVAREAGDGVHAESCVTVALNAFVGMVACSARERPSIGLVTWSSLDVILMIRVGCGGDLAC